MIVMWKNLSTTTRGARLLPGPAVFPPAPPLPDYSSARASPTAVVRRR